MRNNKVDPENVDQKLFEIFSSLGYDGTSMEMLSQATGLKKASLYHRFSGGKQEMAKHVLKNVENWITENIVAVLANKATTPSTRLKKAINAFDSLYKGGNNNCLLRTLSIGPDAAAFKDEITKCFDLITNSFTGLAIEMGFNEKEAKEKASLINPLVQGSLILSGAMNNTIHFKNCLATIPALLQAKHNK